MTNPPSADVDRHAEPGEPQARVADDPSRQPLDTTASEAASLDREFRHLFTDAAPSAAGPTPTVDEWFEALHRLPDGRAPAALCLSGGGIRSATFGLGVLQGLARTGLLQRFDYLSTVSGGGYVGSWLSAWLHRAGTPEGRADVFKQLRASAVGRLSDAAQSCPVQKPKPEPEPLRRLRAYSNYLSPALGWGGDMMSLVAIFGRNLFLHWLVLLPALLALLMLPRLYLALLDALNPTAPIGPAGAWQVLCLAASHCALVAWWANDPPVRRLAVLVGAGVVVWWLCGALQGALHVTLGPLLFVAATLAVGVSVAYMAADLPEMPEHQEPPRESGPPDRFTRWNLLPLLLASLLFSALAPWLAHDSTLRAVAMPVRSIGVSDEPWIGAVIAFGVCFGVVHVCAALAGMAWRRQRDLEDRVPPDVLFELTVTFLVGGIGGAVLLGTMIGLATWWHTGASVVPLTGSAIAQRELYAIVAGPAMLAVFWLTVTVYAGLMRRLKSEEDREWWARAAGLWLLNAIGWSALAAAVLVLPRLLFALADAVGFAESGPASLTGGAALLGVLSSIWGYWSRNGQKLIEQAHGIRARLDASLLELLSVAFIVLLAAVLGLALSQVLERIGNGGRGVATAAPNQPQPTRETPAPPSGVSPMAAQVDKLIAERQADAAFAAHCAKPATPPIVVTMSLGGGAASAALATSAVVSGAAAQRPADCPSIAVSPTQRAAATFQGVLHATRPVPALLLLIALAAMAWVMAYWIGTNTFSLHSLYGNRLVRAYLGASHPDWHDLSEPAGGEPPAARRERRPHRFTGFDPHDNVDLAALAGRRRAAPPAAASVAGEGEVEPAAHRPFPVINAALNLVQSAGDRLEWQQRKAASFTFTPLDCGSRVLGYAPTAHYGRKPVDGARPPDGRSEPDVGGLSLGRAMAISGAAATPNMGYHSSAVVAFAMSFFNVRLGWWLPNTRVPPGDDARAFWERDEPPGGQTLLAETLARTAADTEFVYLSDGGHFENLGLYEMVRRRCRRILVVDATRDADFHHEDLISSIRKIRIDFGISIVFPRGLPTADSCARHGMPWAHGRVHYADADPCAPAGSVVYLKPALWSGLPPDITRYAETSKRRGTPFPHQSTGDQFFDETQFESYRLLGLLTVLKAFGESGDWPGGLGPNHAEPPPAATAPPSAAQRFRLRMAALRRPSQATR